MYINIRDKINIFIVVKARSKVKPRISKHMARSLNQFFVSTLYVVLTSRISLSVSA